MTQSENFTRSHFGEGEVELEKLEALERAAGADVDDLVLVRSDAGDGGWSLHAPGSTDEEIACGDAAYLVSGEAEYVDGNWNRPNDADYIAALQMLAGGR